MWNDCLHQFSEETMVPGEPVIALEARLRDCRNVQTLGVRPNFTDYPPSEAETIRTAAKIYYPSTLYTDLFHAMGKQTFPSHANYKFVQDKIRQTQLFQMLRIPHPRTRVFYGKRQKARIGEYFRFPFVAKVPRGSALGRGVYCIDSPETLSRYCQADHPAYIQEYLPVRRDIRAVVIGQRVVHAYWRVAAPGEFRCNLSAGGSLSFEQVPDEAIDLALHTARSCCWNDVGIDILTHEGRFWVLEANMKYGREGFRQAGIDYALLMEKMIADGEI